MYIAASHAPQPKAKPHGKRTFTFFHPPIDRPRAVARSLSVNGATRRTSAIRKIGSPVFRGLRVLKILKVPNLSNLLKSRPDGGRPEKSRRERLHSCGVSERQCLSAASSVAQPQRGRPRRKAFLRASGSFGSFRPAKRTQLAPLGLLVLFGLRKVQTPRYGSMFRIHATVAGRCVLGHPNGEAACQSGADTPLSQAA